MSTPTRPLSPTFGASSSHVSEPHLGTLTGDDGVKAGAKDWEDNQTRMFGKMISLMLSRPLIDVRNDLKNGDILIKLVEKLSGKSLGIPYSEPGQEEGRMKIIGKLNKLFVCF